MTLGRSNQLTQDQYRVTWVYRRTESTCWTVGYYDPNNGRWVSESDHDTPQLAAARVSYLNGARS